MQHPMKDKIRKLLLQAEDRAGTPEGDVYFAKAFALMAQYEVDERDLSVDDDHDTVTHREFTFHGAYTDMQSALLLGMANALHCEGFLYARHRSVTIHRGMVFGRRRHLDRLSTLFCLINPIMLAQAKDYGGENPSLFHSRPSSLVTQRRSYMRGFISMIADRLEEAESTAAETSSEYALALVDDASLAHAARSEFLDGHPLHNRSHEHRQFDAAAYSTGVSDAKRTDIGQTRIGAQRELGT